MISSLRSSLLLSTISDLIAIYFLITIQLDFVVIYSYIFITKYAYWVGEFIKGLITLSSNSKQVLTLFAGMGIVAIILIQLMNLSGFYLWYLATGTDFIIPTALTNLLTSQLLFATALSIISIILSFIIYLLRKDYKKKQGAISLLNGIFYPIALIFMIIILGLGLLVFRDSRLAIAILFIVILVMDKAILIFEDRLIKDKPIPDFVMRLAERSK